MVYFQERVLSATTDMIERFLYFALSMPCDVSAPRQWTSRARALVHSKEPPPSSPVPLPTHSVLCNIIKPWSSAGRPPAKEVIGKRRIPNLGTGSLADDRRIPRGSHKLTRQLAAFAVCKLVNTYHKPRQGVRYRCWQRKVVSYASH